MRKQFVDINIVVNDELSTLGLQVRRKGPRTHQGHLATIQVSTHLERDLSSLTDVTGTAPNLDTAHSRLAGFARSTAIQ